MKFSGRYPLMSRPSLTIVAWLCFGSLVHDTRATTQVAAQEEHICYGGDYRKRIEFLDLLSNCTVIEGHLKIMFYQKGAASRISKLVFPKLREITGYLLLHRVYGMKSVGHMFPNLAVIRGRELFFDYALVAYEMPQLEDLGLRNLMTITRGSVRLEKNPELCYADTIDWRFIISDQGADHNFFLQNKMVDECDVCPTSCAKLYSGSHISRRNCWNGRPEYCQVICPDRCDQVSGCKKDDSNVCCHTECAGGCYGSGQDQCVACKHVFHNGTCLSKCPKGTYRYMGRRCLTEAECKATPRGLRVLRKAFRDECIIECPRAEGFKEDEKDKSRCIPCGGPCPKICSGTHVDSVANAQRLKGCTVISSYLDIQITEGANIVQELEENLSMIEEVIGHVKVTRSASLVSLSFLKNLRVIHGKDVETNISLYVVDNRNLQEIWNMTTHPKLEIKNGRIYFDLNRKLCVDKIYALAEQIGQPNPTEEDVSTHTNGDEGACDVEEIIAEVKTVASQYALLKWEPFRMTDDRYLMGYVIYHRETKFRNVSIYGQRDACGNDGWKIEDFSKKETNIHLLSELKPWTQYVVYVQTYTVALSKKSGRSRLMYFTTEPDYPTHPRDLIVENDVPNELLVRWKPPRLPKGNVTHYHVYWVAQKLSRTKIDKRDYCTDKIQTYRHRKEIENRHRLEKEKALNDAKLLNGTACACKKEAKEEKILNKERLYQIEFENYLHNYVYRKRPTSDKKKSKMRKGKRIRDMNIPGLNRTKNMTITRDKLASMVPLSTTTTQSPKDNIDDLAANHESFQDILPEAGDNGTFTNNTDDEDDDEEDSVEYLLAVVYNKLEVVLPNLKHFQTYNIEVMACQEYTPSINRKLCSNRAIISETTQPSPTADNIDPATIRSEHGQRDEIIIFWGEPKSPNGLIVTYEIQLARDLGAMAAQVPVCIPHKLYLINGSYRISGLTPGNYTYRIRGTSLAGVGEWTPLKSFQIHEKVYMMGQLTTESLVGIIIGSMLVIFLIIAVIIGGLLYINNKRYSGLPDVLYSSVNPEYVNYEYTPDEWEVERENVQLGKALGHGSFGMVYEGLFQTKKQARAVAVKTVNPNSSEIEKRSFLHEASVMKAFDSHHVVKLMGVVSKGQPALVLMELMMRGDLKSYLRIIRPDADDPLSLVIPPDVPESYRIALEVADGMAYLSSQKFVHRDLAARNCMVAEDLTVKIGDFGMTRDIYETDYYKKGGKGFLPVRWMSPEALHDGVFSSASDVWSFGVVLWEIVTQAAQPYTGFSNEQVVDIVVKKGYMQMPDFCPPRLYELMEWCWSYKCKHRPSFGQIIQYLLEDKIIDHEKFYEVSYYFNGTKEPAEKAVSVEVDALADEEAVAEEEGHVSPSHRVTMSPPDEADLGSCSSMNETALPGSSEPAELAVQIVPSTEQSSSDVDRKPSAITSSTSGDSSKGSVKSNGSAFTNGLANGHAHHNVEC